MWSIKGYDSDYLLSTCPGNKNVLQSDENNNCSHTKCPEQPVMLTFLWSAEIIFV